MPPFGRHPHPEELDTDEEYNSSNDPDLQLRTVRTAASTIAESIRDEQRVRRQKTKIRQRSLKLFRNRSKDKKKANADEPQAEDDAQAAQIQGRRRNIYVNSPRPPSESDASGEPLARYVRNKVRTTSEF